MLGPGFMANSSFFRPFSTQIKAQSDGFCPQMRKNRCGSLEPSHSPLRFFLPFQGQKTRFFKEEGEKRRFWEYFDGLPPVQ